MATTPSLHAMGRDVQEDVSAEPVAPALVSSEPLRFSFVDPSLFRGTDLPDLMRRSARIFSDRPCTPEYYGLSHRVSAIDVFISHNWSTPRALKFLTLAVNFNAPAAIVASNIAALLAFYLQVYGKLPSYAMRFTIYGQTEPSGVFCSLIGTLVFVLVLLFWQTFRRWVGRQGPVVFLDKTCVCQTDADLKRQGIMSLGAFLYNSRSMLILYSDVYLQKLWTVYEIASFLLIFPDGSLNVRPVFAPALVLACMLSITVMRSANLVFRSVVEHMRGTTASLPESVIRPDEYIRLTINVLVISGVLYWWVCKQAQIRERVNAFSIQNAICVSEDDRAIVEQDVARLARQFGVAPPGATQSESLCAFNTLVRRSVPRVLQRSFGRVGIHYTEAFLLFGFLHFNLLDRLSGMIKADIFPVRVVVLKAITIANTYLVYGPLIIVGLTVWLSRRCIQPNFSVMQGAIIVMISITVFIATMFVWQCMFSLMTAAEKSDACLVLFFVVEVILVGLTFAVYRPTSSTQPSKCSPPDDSSDTESDVIGASENSCSSGSDADADSHAEDS